MKCKIGLFCLVALSLCSCGKQGPTAFRGYYSFKTGGAVDLKGTVYDILKDTVKIDTTIREYKIGDRTIRDTTYQYDIRRDTLDARDTVFMRYIVSESGQMHILSDGDALVVTMNVTGGDPIVMGAHTEGDRIVLTPVDRRVLVSVWQEEDRYSSTEDRSTSCYWTISGSGRKLENMVLFDIDYAGKYSYDGFDGEVTESRINCIATENE